MKKRLLALFLVLSFVFPYMTWAAPSALANEESEVNEAKEARETREATEEKEGNTAKEAEEIIDENGFTISFGYGNNNELWRVESKDKSFFFYFDPGTNTITTFRNDVNVTDVIEHLAIPGTVNKIPVTTIGSQAFIYMRAVAVTLPEGLTAIEGLAFSGNNYLESVDIPDSVKTIGTQVFGNCTALKSVRMPASLDELSNNVFSGCTSLVSVSIPKGITSIRASMFSGCKALTSVTIPDGVTTIEEWAFAECTSLTAVTIPASVTKIVPTAFCRHVKNEYGYDELTGLDNIKNIYFGGTKEQWDAIEIDSWSGETEYRDFIDQLTTTGGIHFNSPGPDTPVKPDPPVTVDGIRVQVSAPSELHFSADKSKYENNPFTVEVSVTNEGTKKFEFCSATIDLSSAGGALTDLSPQFPFLPTLEPGESTVISIPLEAALQSYDTEIEYLVRVTDGAQNLFYQDTFSIRLPGTESPFHIVTFDLNGGQGSVADRIVKHLDRLTPPANPTRPGYTFFKWYYQPDPNSAYKPWDFQTPVTQNMTLFARWENNKLRFGTETYQFENTDSDFFKTGETQDYAMRDDYFDILCDNLSWGIGPWNQRKKVKEERDKKWYGSCFGMSAVLSLTKAGQLSPGFFQSRAANLNDLDYPVNNNTVRSLLQYYHLIQFTKAGESTQEWWAAHEPTNIKALINKVKTSRYPVIFAVEYRDENTVGQAGRHEMVAYDYSVAPDGDYLLKIWDPNCKCILADDNQYNILRLKPDGSSATFQNFHHHPSKALIKESISIEDGVFNGFNLQQALKALGYGNGWQQPPQTASYSARSDEAEYILYTNYPSFTVSCSDGTSAVIRDGSKQSGNLEISDGSYLNEPGYDCNLAFALRALNTENTYTVTPDAGQAGTYRTNLMSYSDGPDGFYANVDAAAAGDVTFFASGKTSTSFSGAVSHSVSVVRNDAETPWYGTTASGSSKGITVEPGATEAAVSSVDNASLTLTVEDDYQETDFRPLPVDTDGVRIVESRTGPGTAEILDGDDAVLNSVTPDHTVVFYSLSGTAVPAQRNIPHNGTASRPADPVLAGSTFLGWYPSTTGTEPWDFSTPITENIRLYARWSTAGTSVVPTPPVSGSADTSGSNDAAPSYRIEVSAQISGGTVKVTPTSAGENQRVTITVKPVAGYQLETLKVTDSKGSEIRLTDQGNGKYTFSMPGSKVFVEAFFTSGAPSGSRFADVPSSLYCYDAVQWAVEQGITSGTGATAFSPDAPCTRAQAVTFLWRAAGSPAPARTENPFADVPSGAYYESAVLWAVEQGITSGTGATAFSPNAVVTRGQIATFLWRAAGSPAVNGESPFRDVPADAYYAGAVRWAVRHGITTGVDAVSFRPDGGCTHGHLVSFLYRGRDGM